MAFTNATSYDQPAVTFHHRVWVRKIKLDVTADPTPADGIRLFKLGEGCAARPLRARACSSAKNGATTGATFDIKVLKTSDDSTMSKLLEAAEMDGLLDATDDAASSGLDAGEAFTALADATYDADTEYYLGLVWVAAITGGSFVDTDLLVEVEFTGTDD